MRGPTLESNPFPSVRVLWSPLSNNVDYKPYWPGDAYVDVGGADIYKEATWRAAVGEVRRDLQVRSRTTTSRSRRRSGACSAIDDPQFVQDMCTFLKTHAVESEEFYASQPGAIFDLANKPLSRAMHRICITPLAAPLPSWAAGGAGSATGRLAVASAPDVAGPDVTFPVTAKLTVPIAHWDDRRSATAP